MAALFRIVSLFSFSVMPVKSFSIVFCVLAICLSTTKASHGSNVDSVSAIDYEHDGAYEASLDHYTATEMEAEQPEVNSRGDTSQTIEEANVWKLSHAADFFQTGCKVMRHWTGSQANEQKLLLSAYRQALREISDTNPQGYTEKMLMKRFMTIVTEALGWTVDGFVAFRAKYRPTETRQLARWERSNSTALVSRPSHGARSHHGVDLDLGLGETSSNAQKSSCHEHPSHQHDMSAYDEEFTEEDIHKVGC